MQVLGKKGGRGRGRVGRGGGEGKKAWEGPVQVKGAGRGEKGAGLEGGGGGTNAGEGSWESWRDKRGSEGPVQVRGWVGRVGGGRGGGSERGARVLRDWCWCKGEEENRGTGLEGQRARRRVESRRTMPCLSALVTAA